MAQRYKVFFNDSLLHIALPGQSLKGIPGETVTLPERKEVASLISMMETSGVHTYGVRTPDPDGFFSLLCSFYQMIGAAGGLVRHPVGKYLFIRRFGKWDLPKGKIEPGETPEKAAVREVSEECGISGLRITREQPSTYHTYRLDGQRVMKRTWWFAMEYAGTLETVPQTEEGITEAVWLVPSRFDMVMENTYRSIAELIGEMSWPEDQPAY
jgi:ADP-ribose pyrophosphatase YjhB (NUDIX family)